ncbi:hypothetical protein [Pseudolactococcus laudensis]|uniref:hypothetical protein n=1 Tax=Pseudolactococcus laudensis TaxID=1494461 RepID=UPI0015DEE5AA|nr:hypothetical protein [Lactococcus laudensis]
MSVGVVVVMWCGGDCACPRISSDFDTNFAQKYDAKTVIFLRNNTRLVKKSRLLCENGNLSEKQYEIGKKSRLMCEIGNLSEKQYEIRIKKPFDVRKR